MALRSEGFIQTSYCVVTYVVQEVALGGGSVLNIVAYAWAGFGAAFGPLVIMSLFWRRMNWVGALAGMVCGVVMVVHWRQLDPFGLGLYEMIPGFVGILLFNPLGPSPSERMQSDFEVVKEASNERCSPE